MPKDRESASEGYQPKEKQLYPKRVFFPDGTSRVVNNPAEEQQAAEEAREAA